MTAHKQDLSRQPIRQTGLDGPFKIVRGRLTLIALAIVFTLVYGTVEKLLHPDRALPGFRRTVHAAIDHRNHGEEVAGDPRNSAGQGESSNSTLILFRVIVMLLAIRAMTQIVIEARRLNQFFKETADQGHDR